jgi:hypothetical protein
LGALTVLVAMVATVALALYQFVPPAVVSADAPAKEFSAERAMAHLEVIARKPHPVGSPENARVRDYLIQEISAMGLRPQVQKTTVFESVPDEADVTTVKNILVRIEGKAPTNRAVLITAHYDSVVTGPGAGDNGMSVATMLETLRAVQAGPPSRNDLIFLFNDGEEAGLIGSTAFVEQHPWAKDVGVVFDFDRSDGRGVAILSWTAAHDGWLVQEIANALPGTVATSADNDSERQDYDNDLHAFAAVGFTGAHFDNVSGIRSGAGRYVRDPDPAARASGAPALPERAGRQKRMAVCRTDSPGGHHRGRLASRGQRRLRIRCGTPPPRHSLLHLERRHW